MSTVEEIVVNPENQWRLETPGAQGWSGSAWPGNEKKYFIVSTDSHLGPPPTLFRDRIEDKYKSRLPRLEVNKENGRRTLHLEGRRPMPLIEDKVTGEDLVRMKSGSAGSTLLLGGGPTVGERVRDQNADGIDAEIIFPNGPGLLMWGTHDPLFAQAQCRIWNDWAWEACAEHRDRCFPVAALATGDIEGSVAEVQRAAKMGFKVLALPCKPIWGPGDASHLNYNLKDFDPLWAAIQDTDLAITFHVSTGTDPRAARGDGGAIINYVVHALAPTIEPVVNLCTSGALERFPGLRFATIEANAGWLAWLLEAMDEGYRKHHMWVSPKLKQLPGELYRQHGFASVCEDQAAYDLCEKHRLTDNLMFANDYPHHEGSWPHSAQTIERRMGALQETTRRKILGLNAARFLKIDIPKTYQR